MFYIMRQPEPLTKLYSKIRFLGSLLHVALIVAIFGCTTVTSVFAQEKKPSSIFEYLTQKEAVHLKLSTDLTKMNGARASDDYQPAIFTDQDGKKWKVEIKTRGKFRRKNGYFPPLKIKFSKKDLEAQGLSDHNDVRVSLPFYEDDKGNDLIVREYICYRMYEHLTPASVRARLVRLTLSDSHVESWKHEIYTIFMEDDDELEKRLNVKEEEIYGLEPDSLISTQAALTCAYNYFIGNADFEVAGMRNVKLMRGLDGGKIILIPYDFDFSGVVNAPYSKPASMSGLKTIKQRFLMADGLKSEHLRRAFLVLQKESSNLKRISQSKYLKSTSQDEVWNYLQSFYNNLSKDNLPGGAAVAAPLID
jgi:hypothetical protein